MLSRRIIACLDVKDGKVVKGVRFRRHEIVGDMIELARYYRNEGVDELVFYDITASAERRVVDATWVEGIAEILDIPFCVAGGIRSVEEARKILRAGADKISVNSPALERPPLIGELADEFGSQCVVVGIDSRRSPNGFEVFFYTGSEASARSASRSTAEWAQEAQSLGAGEIVLNCMDNDGTREGYDVEQLAALRPLLQIPLVASGGAGCARHFIDVFKHTGVDGALAAGVFHRKELEIASLKCELEAAGIPVR